MKNVELLLNFVFWLNVDSVFVLYCVFEYVRLKVVGLVMYWLVMCMIWIDFVFEKFWLIMVLNSVLELFDYVCMLLVSVVLLFV